MAAPTNDVEALRRQRLQRQLREQRAELERLLPPPVHSRGRAERQFPRSHTMRLLLTEPALAAAASVVVARLLGRRWLWFVRTLPVMVAALRIGRAVGAVGEDTQAGAVSAVETRNPRPGSGL